MSGTRAGRATRTPQRRGAGRRGERPHARTRRDRVTARGWPASQRPDPIALLEEQAESRVPELVPIRYGRMLVSPFAFFRGAALIMAADLAATPAVRRQRPALRRRAPVELRRVRLTRAAADVRHQRLRRNAPRPVGVGRETSRRRASRSSVATGHSAEPIAERSSGRRRASTARRCGRLPACRRWPPGTTTWTPTRSSAGCEARSVRSESPRRS